MNDNQAVNIDANEVVKSLKEILKISEADVFEAKLSEIYLSPINAPLMVLKDGLGVAAGSITINEDPNVSIYQKTLDMRKELENLLLDFPEKRNQIAKWIVESWGGIPAGKNDDSLNECIHNADKIDEENADKFNFERIASWSKYLAFKNPKKYAIYDARVIYSLNWLLYRSGQEHYFPFLSGRNSVMELLDYQILLFLGPDGEYRKEVQAALSDDIRKRRMPDRPESSAKSHFSAGLKKKRELFIRDSDAFDRYCKLLQEVSTLLFSDKDPERLTKTEMLLFAVADAEIAESVLESM